MTPESQSAIEATGRRITANGVSEENKDVFNSDWGSIPNGSFPRSRCLNQAFS